MLGRRERQTRPALEHAKVAIEQACGKLNPILAVVVIGLAILNISCYTALELGRRQLPAAQFSEPSPPPALARGAPTGPP